MKFLLLHFKHDNAVQICNSIMKTATHVYVAFPYNNNILYPCTIVCVWGGYVATLRWVRWEGGKERKVGREGELEDGG